MRKQFSQSTSLTLLIPMSTNVFLKVIEPSVQNATLFLGLFGTSVKETQHRMIQRFAFNVIRTCQGVNLNDSFELILLKGFKMAFPKSLSPLRGLLKTTWTYWDLWDSKITLGIPFKNKHFKIRKALMILCFSSCNFPLQILIILNKPRLEVACLTNQQSM